MGMLHLVSLEDVENVYSCKYCKTQLALAADIFSKFFQCGHGKAYLFCKVVNISVGQKKERQMTTGMHTIADISCVSCGSILGWKYETAHVKSQKYKEGMFILERFKVIGPDESNYSESDDTQDDEEDMTDAVASFNFNMP